MKLFHPIVVLVSLFTAYSIMQAMCIQPPLFVGMAGGYQGLRTYKEPLLSSLEEDESSDGVVEVEPSFIQLEIMDNDFRRNP